MINDKVVPVSASLLAFLEDWLEWAKSPECADTPDFKKVAGLCSCLRAWKLNRPELLWKHSLLLADLLGAFTLGGYDQSYPFGDIAYDICQDNGTQHLDPNRLAWVEKTIEVTKNLNNTENISTTGGNV